ARGQIRFTTVCTSFCVIARRHQELLRCAWCSDLQAQPVWRSGRRTNPEGSNILLCRLRRNPAVVGHHDGCDRAVGERAPGDSCRRERDSRSERGGLSHLLPCASAPKHERRPWTIHLRRTTGGQRKLSYRPCGPQIFCKG